ncbi:Transglycosylase SLT domain-containing protein [Atopomonas hussainii]|uniref:Transglycosylase SLT domain-containing protein n=1 Tax=Atopomonas hussainii TaxID=1429083 RepID=A0A1H7RVL9_9GAMM|nr:Transglycosylase SLT domain-containing protein [Atopomonas hussainii]
MHLAPDALEDEDLLQFANSGLIDNLVVDQHKARLWEKILPNIHVRHAVAVRENGQIAWMLRQSNPQLKAEIDAHISHELGKNQKDHNWRLIKYLKRTAYLNNTQSAQARARFSKTVELFKHYSAQYDADFILMIAQGYQESRLNQAARSPVGAIGIMQLMPATGKEMGVGDIHELSANIHAGVKYIQKIRNSYFADPAIDDLNRHLLSFAAYNAGPNRINKLRKVAAQRGLDPNIWHNNVERVVAEKVGREPVNYVANIYAYYVAYTLAMQQGNDRAEAREHFTPQAQ